MHRSYILDLWNSRTQPPNPRTLSHSIRGLRTITKASTGWFVICTSERIYCYAMDTNSTFKTLSTLTSRCACLWYEHHHSFVYLGLQFKWSQFSSNISHNTGCIQKGSHAWKWPDLITTKPDYVSTLGYHWTDHTGRPLGPQVHWDATGTTLADASIQWCPGGDPVLICIIGTHWNTTGRPLEDHWKHTGYQQPFL